MVERPARRIRAITFDLDYTLWDLEGVLHRAERLQHEFLARHCPEVAERYDRAALHALRLRLYEERPELRHDVTALRKTVLRIAVESCGYSAELAEAAFHVFLDARHEVTLFEDVEPLLEQLHGRYVLGVITNGNAEVWRLPVGRYFDFAVSPAEVGAAKPARVIFEAACHRAGVEPEEAIHVGDEPEADVVGPANHGMLPVWLNRKGLDWPADFARPACLELRSLSELGRLLSRWAAEQVS